MKEPKGFNTSAKCSLATAFSFRAGIRAKILIFTVAAQRRIYTGLSPFFQLRHDGKASKDNENITPFSFNNRNKPVGIFFDS